MLKFIIFLFIFCAIFFIIYKEMKHIIFFWQKELSTNDNLEDRVNKLTIEGDKLHEDLKEKEKELKKESKKIENLKKKGF